MECDKIGEMTTRRLHYEKNLANPVCCGIQCRTDPAVFQQAEAGTFTFTPSKPAETTTQQQTPAAQPQVKSLKLAVVP